MLFGIIRTPSKVLTDALLFSLAWVCAFLLRFGGDIPPPYAAMMWSFLPLAITVKLLVFMLLGAYHAIWRYTSLSDLTHLIRGVAAGWVVLVFALFLFHGDAGFPRGVSLIDALLTLVFCGGLRLAPRLTRELASTEVTARLPGPLRRFIEKRAHTASQKPTLVVGAGDAGESVVRMLRRGEIPGYRPVALVDDDHSKKGKRIHGVPVRGTTDDIPRLLEKLRCEIALIAIPSADREAVLRIAAQCRQSGVEIRIVPDLGSLISGRLSLSDIRELNIASILGRDKVDLGIEDSASYIEGRRILVTGAGGSIGAELCRQIIEFRPSEIVLFGRGENSIFKVFNELYEKGIGTRLHQVIGDVINRPKLEGVFARFRPHIVFHAGADKHVPLMETNPDEAVLNNVVGTRNLVEVADSYGVERTVCISTDKAVNPTSVMGCCKRVAEMFIQSAEFENTRTVAVRFGNVLGSRGSVVPLFENQIARGGPVTVTDPNVVRYFMTIPEAVQLVIQAGAMPAEGGEVFILKMGDPVSIVDLARNLIRLHGLEPDLEIPIEITGLRPGEKLREELIVSGETVTETSHPKILRAEANGPGRDNGTLNTAIDRLADLAVRMDAPGIRSALKELVPEYEPYQPASVTTVSVKAD